LQDGQGEAGGFSCAGLRGAKQVAACEDDGDGLRLDGGGNGVTLLGDSAEQLGRKAECFKRRSDDFLLLGPRRINLRPVQAETI